MASRMQRAIGHVRAHATAGRLPFDEIDVHFHPDAAAEAGSVLDQIRADGEYRSQFETGTSNGGLTARPGGDRWRWESALFAGAYDDAPADERPRYGAVNLDGEPYGAAPRFGSAFLRLGPTVLERVTLCHPDSVFAPTAVGTPDRAGAVLASAAAETGADPLDRYIEAQVHGGLDLGDVEALVLDPAFRGTAIADTAMRLGCAVEWHPGYRLRIDGLDARLRYRGAAAVEGVRALAVEGAVDPAILGAARAEGRLSPQVLKHVWHLIARFGRLA